MGEEEPLSQDRAGLPRASPACTAWVLESDFWNSDPSSALTTSMTSGKQLTPQSVRALVSWKCQRRPRGGIFMRGRWKEPAFSLTPAAGSSLHRLVLVLIPTARITSSSQLQASAPSQSLCVCRVLTTDRISTPKGTGNTPESHLPMYEIL